MCPSFRHARQSRGRIRSGLTKRVRASTMMEKHKAIRKTALISAPSTSMRTQPKVLRLEGLFAICAEKHGRLLVRGPKLSPW